jgi:hypothetical protein
MARKSLAESNPYLQDPAQYRRSLIANVASSTAIETGAPIREIAKILEQGSAQNPLSLPRM